MLVKQNRQRRNSSVVVPCNNARTQPNGIQAVCQRIKGKNLSCRKKAHLQHPHRKHWKGTLIKFLSAGFFPVSCNENHLQPARRTEAVEKKNLQEARRKRVERAGRDNSRRIRHPGGTQIYREKQRRNPASRFLQAAKRQGP